MLTSDILPKLTSVATLRDNILKPQLISPEIFETYDELFAYADEIRDLKLVPIKDDAMHKFYNSHDRKELAKEQSVKLRHRDIVMEDNRFPYWLPRDVQQRVIWVKDGVSNRRVVEFIINVIQSEKLSNFISFERPNDSKIALIRGTIPQIRHLHFWTQIK